jgi:allophanate hydrolase subunit 2
VQVTNGGELLVLGPDAAVTGGYPVVAAIDGPSLAALAQRRPGRLVRFTRT